MKKLVAVFLLVCAFGIVVPVTAFAAENQPQKVASMSAININSASAVELQNLPGIGPVTAERIVAYRTEHGRFASVDDLIQVKGVGEKTLENIRKLIRTE